MEDIFAITRLKYKKGELIIKEGDYGISIYKIIQGKVLIFTESEGMEIPLANLAEGKVIGEMVFLSRSGEQRSASARALEDSELEVWHPKMLAKEYEQMPPVLKHIADQALNRLVRMNKLVAQLTAKLEQKKEKPKDRDQRSDERRYYRKQVSLHFVARPTQGFTNAPLTGEIKDISLGGVRLELRPRSVSKFPFKPGDEFVVNTALPNGRELDFVGKITTLMKSDTPGTVLLGMSFTELNSQARKDLGFFLMCS